MTTEDLKFFVFTPQCFDDVTSQNFGDFFAHGCHAFVLSKLLGYGIIAGSAALKLPQIYKIMTSQSGKGLSIPSLAIETLGFATTTAYFYRQSYALSTYGEAPLIFLQNIILLMLIFQFENQFTLVNIATVVGLLGFLASGISGALPLFIIETVFSSQFVIIIGARVPQIWANYQNRSTGALAFVTVLMQLAGTLARLFTTLQEVDDIIVLLQFVLAAVLNGLLFIQFFIYPATVTDDSGKGKKETNENVTKGGNEQVASPRASNQASTPRRRKKRRKD